MTRKRYKLTEAAKLLGINEWTLRRWVYAGKAPAIKTETGRVFIPRGKKTEAAIRALEETE